jgi:hypothetical protein
MIKLSQEQIRAKEEYRKTLDRYTTEIPAIAANAMDAINLSPKYKSILAITIGSEIVKMQLNALVMLRRYITEMKKAIGRNGHSIPSVDEDRHMEKALGSLIAKFDRCYEASKNHPQLLEKLSKLNERRITGVHDGIVDHMGDLEDLNEDLRSYVMRHDQPIQEVIDELITLYNKESDELVALQEK